MTQPQGHFGYQIIQIIKTCSLGVGSYGAVYRALCDELPCAAKIIHPTLFKTNDPGARKTMERFEKECQFLSSVRHPHIVQYLGVSRDPDSGLPVLLMELMDSSLTQLLEQSQEPLPYHIQVDLCHDVALALVYLHANGIIHRDLSSNNVLLIGPGNRAKVTDFGTLKLADANPRLTPMTMCPGTLVYMPPEALDDSPTYTNKLDCFSFGVLDIQILTQQFPSPSQLYKIIEINDPRFPTGQIKIPVPEVERRQSHIHLIDPVHPILPVALDCLKDRERKRPSAQELCHRLAALKATPQYGESVEQARSMTSQGKEKRIREMQREREKQAQQIKQHDQQIRDLKQRVKTQSDHLQVRERELAQQICSLQLQLQEKNQEMEQRMQKLNTPIRPNGLVRTELQQKPLAVRREETIKKLRQKHATRHERIPLQQLPVDEPPATVEDSRSVGTNSRQPKQTQTAAQHPTLIQTAAHQPLERKQTQTAAQYPTEPTQTLTAAHQPTVPKQTQTAARQPTVPKQTQTAARQPIVPKQTQTAARQPTEAQAASGPSKVDRADSFQLQWRYGGRTPLRWELGSAAVNGSVSYFNPECGYGFDIFGYEAGTWSTLPECGRCEFAMAIINGLLTVIGGLNNELATCNSFLSLTGEGQGRKWVEQFPPMPTKRAKPAVVCSGKCLVVAGGREEDYRQLNTVEVMDTETLQWFTASSLPDTNGITSSCSAGFATLCGDQVYVRCGLQGNWTQTLVACSLTDLLQSCQSTLQSPESQSWSLGARFGTLLGKVLKQHKENEHANVWRKVAELPYECSTVTSMYGQLLAVGGVDPAKEDPRARKSTDSIHRYNPTNDRWEVISHMPTARCNCLVTVLPSNELMVVGGRMHGAYGDCTNIVEIGTLL